MCALGHFNWPLNVETSLFVCNRGDTIQYHGGLRSRELGQELETYFALLYFMTFAQCVQIITWLISSHKRSAFGSEGFHPEIYIVIQ